MTNDPFEETRAPLIAHFAEFKKRLMIALAAWLIASIASYLLAPEIYRFLTEPLASAFDQPETKRLIYTSLTEAFFTYMKLALFSGFFIAFPIIAAQFYYFLAPGLYKQEKAMLLPYLICAPLLCFAGAALAYYGIFPLAWQFFVGFETGQAAAGLPIELEAKVGEYLSLVMQIVIAFGLAFQLPVLLVSLVHMGLMDLYVLKRGRKYAAVILIAFAAILTPPDVISQIGLFIPLYLLYEIAIFIAQIIHKKQEQAEHA